MLSGLALSLLQVLNEIFHKVNTDNMAMEHWLTNRHHLAARLANVARETTYILRPYPHIHIYCVHTHIFKLGPQKTTDACI